jgi:hypothetical protein
MGVRRLSIAAIVSLGALAFAGSAQACSCSHMVPRRALSEADAAIVGKLVKVVPRGRRWADYRYRVRHVYRGRARLSGRAISVRSPRQAAACALPRRLGHRYGLFLLRRHGRWRAGICSTIAPRRLRAAARRSGSPGGPGGPQAGPPASPSCAS